MEMRCAMCGKKVEINQMDKNYEAAKLGKPIYFICDQCAAKTTHEARKQQEA